MKYDFDKVWDRVDTDSIKWDRQFKFGVPTGLIPFWIADTDFGTLPEAVTAIQKRLEHPLFGYTSTGKRTNETVRAGISAVIMWIFRWRHFHRQKVS